MRLTRARVLRLPGIERAFTVEGFGEGMTLVLGPNGAGKSSLCRLLHLALWPDRRRLEGTLATLEFEHAGARWQVEVESGRVQWRRDGERCEAPPIPDERAAPAARLGLVDLVRAGEAESGLAERIRRELAGGYDLEALRAARAEFKANRARSLAKSLREASEAVRRAERRQAELEETEREQARLEGELEAAKEARRERERLDRLLALAQARSERRGLELQLAAFPAELARLRGDERERLDELEEEIERARRSLEATRGEFARVEAELEELAGDPDDVTRNALGNLAADAQRAEDRAQDTGTGAAERAAAREALEALLAEWPAAAGAPPRDLEAWLGPNAASALLDPAREAFARSRGAGAGSVLAVRVALGAVLALGGLVLAAFGSPPALALGSGLVGMGILVHAALAARVEGDAEETDAARRRFEEAASRLLGTLVELRRAEAASGEADERAERAFGRLTEAFERAGLETPPDLAFALAHLKQLAERARERERLIARKGELEREAQRLERSLAGARERRGKLLGPLGPEAEAELDAWLERLDDFRDRKNALEIARTSEARARAALEPEVPAEDEPLDIEGLEREREGAAERAERFEALTEQVAELRAELEAARKERGLREALRARAAALDELAAERERAIEARLADTVLSSVAERHARESAPPLVRRAVRRFAEFTRGRHELLLDERGLRARDARTGQVQLPEELSDGTRVQLFLAARWSYLESLEGGTRLPIVLDEALATTDPERFAAIAEALLRVASEGRQVLYLGAGGDEFERWSELAAALGESPPACIDLSAARGLPAAVRDPQLLRVRRVEVPAPGGRSAAEYGALLGVPLPDPFAEPGALHLFHLLRDRLDLLHRLLAGSRTERLGEWETLRRRGLATVADEREAAELDARARVARALFEAWRIGRPPPLDEATLRDSSAISDIYRERVLALAADLGWDGARLLAVLEARADQRVSGFRSKAAEQLRAEFEQAGWIATREPLPAIELLARAREAAHASGDQPVLDEDALSRLVDTLTAALAAGLERLRPAGAKPTPAEAKRDG